MFADEVDAALRLDTAWGEQLRSSWIELIRCLVFGDVSSSRLGALPKARRQALHTGERLAAVLASRDWIPHPRERLKNALASALALREALVQLERALRDLDRGTECRALQAHLTDLRHVIDAKLASHEVRWAGLLDAQLTAANREHHDEA